MGTTYKLNLSVSFASSYTNGNPWSVVMGGTTIISGAGASAPWTVRSLTFTCGATATNNLLQFRVASNNNRSGYLMVDNITVTVA